VVRAAVLRVLEHLRRHGCRALEWPPRGPVEHEGTPVVPVPAVSIPGVPVLPVGLPTRRLQEVMAGGAPDVVYFASPLRARCERPRAGSACRRSRVYQTDVAGFVRAYRAGATACTVWRWTCRLHWQADRTLAPSAAAAGALVAAGVERA
jgi:phosphatidylinositol alpha 1,6-mannosyltransferase